MRKPLIEGKKVRQSIDPHCQSEKLTSVDNCRDNRKIGEGMEARARSRNRLGQRWTVPAEMQAGVIQNISSKVEHAKMWPACKYPSHCTDTAQARGKNPALCHSCVIMKVYYGTEDIRGQSPNLKYSNGRIDAREPENQVGDLVCAMSFLIYTRFSQNRVRSLFCSSALSRNNAVSVTGSWRKHFHSTRNNLEPLKIVFCGSDKFSTESFKQVLEYQRDNANQVEFVDLITRRPKPKGRGRSNVEETEIQKYTNTFNSTSEIQSQVRCFTPETDEEFFKLADEYGYNLVIAVSYGRLIPGDFLSKLKYGGLNVHPSLLPKYRGAAPLHAALLNRDKFTGVSLQTLHPTKFDQGLVLFQTPEIPLIETETLSSLTEKLAPLGAEGLLKVISEKLYENPIQHAIVNTEYKKSYTRKVTTDSRKVILETDTVASVMAKYRTFGSVFMYHDFMVKKKKKSPAESQRKRVQLEGLEDVSDEFTETFKQIGENLKVGEYYLDVKDKDSSRLIFKVQDGFISATSIKMEAHAACDAHQLHLSLNKRGIVSQQFLTN